MPAARHVSSLLRAVVATAWRERISQLSAAVAFYTVFSLAPMLILAVAIAGYVFGRDAAREELVARVGEFVGPQGAEVVRNVMVNVRQRSSLATLLGSATVLLGASVAFAQLQDALNQLWKVKPKSNRVVILFLRKRVLSFLMVLGIGVLLLASLVATTALSAAHDFMQDYFDVPVWVLHAISFAGAVLLATVLFAVIFKILPDARIAWKDVWVGAAVTALLFAVGSSAIGHYLGTSSVGSAYGAAGSFFIFLLWIYYSAHVFFLGAAFTQEYSSRFGSGIEPSRGARRA